MLSSYAPNRLRQQVDSQAHAASALSAGMAFRMTTTTQTHKMRLSIRFAALDSCLQGKETVGLKLL